MKITDGTQAAGKVLTSMDANGNANWQAPANQNSGFLAYSGGVVGYPSSSSSFYRVDFTTESYDDGNNFSTAPSTYYFIAPANGVYHFDIDLLWQLTTVANPYYIVMQLGNGISTIHETFTSIPANASSFTTTHRSVDVKLTNGQTVGLYVSQNSGAEQKINGGYTRFTGHRIY